MPKDEKTTIGGSVPDYDAGRVARHLQRASHVWLATALWCAGVLVIFAFDMRDLVVSFGFGGCIALLLLAIGLEFSAKRAHRGGETIS